MVFIIVKIVLNLTILKDWFGCNYNDTNNLLELYNNDFSSGVIDKGAPIAQSAWICASVGSSKTWQEKKWLNELFENCLFSKANVFGPLHDKTIKLTMGTSRVFSPVLV